MRRYRSPAEHRRRQLNARRGSDEMWEGLRRLYGKPADPDVAADAVEQRQRERAAPTQERIR
jgi:hypothetical protein